VSHRRTSGKDWIRESTRQAIYLRDGGACAVCGACPDLDECVRLSLDHVDTKGGNEPTNLATVCLSCNSKRRDHGAHTLGPDALARLHEAAARPLTPALRREGLGVARALRPGRFAAEKARKLNARHRAAPPPREEAPF
jgi:hypothetical protein